MKASTKPFALALKQAGLRPLDFCRAVNKLTGQNYSPVMTSRWISGLHEAPAPAVALAVLLGKLPEEERRSLIAGPPRKKYVRRSNLDMCPHEEGTYPKSSP